MFASGGLPIDDAVQLFADRAREVAPAFQIEAANRALVESICTRLDKLSVRLMSRGGSDIPGARLGGSAVRVSC